MTPKSNRESVLCAIHTICEHRSAASKQQIVAMTGLKHQIVDEHVKNLRESGKINMIVGGFYEPADTMPERLVSVTILPMGRYKIEIGDLVNDISGREAFSLAKMMAGQLTAFRAGM